MKYEPRLDAIRGLAAMAIIFFHWGVFPVGWLGVQLFFVLSGFLITQVLMHKRTSGAGFGTFLGDFFYNRALRLFPLYFGFALCWAVIYFVTHKPPAFAAEAPYLFTYTLNIRGMFPGYTNPPWYGHFWSLAAEWQFYLVWPLIVWLCTKRQLVWVAFILILVSPILRVLTGEWAASLDWSNSLIRDQRSFVAHVAPWSPADAFACGALLALPGGIDFFRKPAVTGLALVATAVFAASVVWLGSDLLRIFYVRCLVGYTALNLLFASVIALVVSHSTMTRFTEWRPLQYLGVISYGIYVLHNPIIGFLKPVFTRNGFGWKSSVGLTATICLTLLLAHCSYYYYEKRFLKLKRRSTRVSEGGAADTASHPAPLPVAQASL